MDKANLLVSNANFYTKVNNFLTKPAFYMNGAGLKQLSRDTFTKSVQSEIKKPQIKETDADFDMPSVEAEEKALCEADIRNLEEYKNDTFYYEFNNHLRKDSLDEEEIAVCESLDKAFETEGEILNDGAILYRGIHKKYDWINGNFKSDIFDNVKPGDIIPADKAYMSTTTDINVALDTEYVGQRDGFNPDLQHGHLLEIHAPKGTKVLDIEKVIKKYDGKIMALNESEKLLPRNVALKVIGVEPYRGNSKLNIDVIKVEIVEE